MSELSGRVFVFTGETFELALEEWVQEQLSAYPHQEELIHITAAAMRDFLGSESVQRRKMEVPGMREGQGKRR